MASTKQTSMPGIDEFLLINKYTQTFLGLWPEIYVKPNLKTIYMIYRLITVPFLCFFLSTFGIKVYYTPLEKFSDELLEGAATGVLYTVAYVKLYYCTSSLTKKLIKEVYDEEEKLNITSDEDWLNVWKQDAKYNASVARMFQSLGFFTLLPYIAFPLYEKFSLNNSLGNETDVVPSLPFKFYVPFDLRYQYNIAYVYQIIGGFYATVSICSADTLLIAFMIFATCQCRMLQQTLIKLGETSYLNVEDKIIDKCVITHQNIIRYIINTHIKLISN